MASSGNIEIEKFNGQSFELWKLNIEDLVVDKDQWIVVDLGTKPTTMLAKDWGSEGKEHNTIVFLRFIIVECIRGSFGKGFVGQVRDFVPI